MRNASSRVYLAAKYSNQIVKSIPVILLERIVYEKAHYRSVSLASMCRLNFTYLPLKRMMPRSFILSSPYLCLVLLDLSRLSKPSECNFKLAGKSLVNFMTTLTTTSSSSGRNHRYHTFTFCTHSEGDENYRDVRLHKAM